MPVYVGRPAFICEVLTMSEAASRLPGGRHMKLVLSALCFF